MASKKHLICIEKYKIIYAPIPKAANSSMKWLLAGILPKSKSTPYKPPKQLYWTEATQGQSTLVDPRHVANMDCTGWFTFTVVRNPLDRLVSCYNNKVVENHEVNDRLHSMGVRSKMEFGEFVERVCPVSDSRTEIHLRSQHFSLSHLNRPVVQYVAKFENLEHDVGVIRERLARHTGKEVPSLPRRNMRRSRDDDYMEYFNDRGLLRLAVKRYRKDFKWFYPQDLRAIGMNNPKHFLLPSRLTVLHRRLKRSLGDRPPAATP